MVGALLSILLAAGAGLLTVGAGGGAGAADDDLARVARGLEGLSLGDAGVRFELAHPLPAWAWALLVLALAGLAGLTYWRLQGPRAARVALAGLRALTLVLLLLLLTGPRLVRPNLSTEPDWVVVMVDRSASMLIPDAPVAGPAAGTPTRQTREAQLLQALGTLAPTLDALAEDRRILWLGFDASAYELPVEAGEAGGAPRPVLDEPTGRRTAIAASLEDALGLVASRPVAGVVILSDGRSIDQVGQGLRDRLKRVDVFGVALGSPEALPDVGLARAEAPGAAFVNDSVPVRIDLESLGVAGASDVTVRVVDLATGLVLGEQRVESEELDGVGEGTFPMTITIRPTQAGSARWRVEVEPERGDLISANNSAELEIELVDRPLRVVYFDGYPRWEQRYIKNLLLRESSIRGTAMILSPDRRYAQDGDETLASIPRTVEGWSEFDVVVLGDFRADLLSREQAESLRQHVATRGAGVLWIAGPGSMPRTWGQSPLADLLPMSVSGGEGGAEIPEVGQGVTVWRTALAERLGVLELGDADASGLAAWPMAVSDPRSGWSILRWSQALEPARLKATAEVLALGVPESAWTVGEGGALEEPGTSTLESAVPLVASMRYGAGRVIYVATDEIWRWRYGRGEALTERFWIPLIRALGRDRLARTGQSAVLELTPRQARVDQPVRMVVRLLDQALVDRRSESISLRVGRVGSGGDELDAGVVRLSPEGGENGRSTYAATWVATQPGRYRVEADDALLSGLSGEVVISHPDDEQRRLETDHALLASLSEPNAGRVMGMGELGTLADLPSRARTIEGEPDIMTLWDTPLALGLLVGLLVVEWAGRRLIKLT